MNENILNNPSKIKVLDEHLVNLIAAGEVIERASSVVKELVENSIDAGATNIEISLIESGLKEITVHDNGCGMNEYDLKYAILPHATSKIKNDSDLFSIHTLGFRGEALASIIAVSNVKIKSCDGVNKGTMLGLKAGVITSEAYIGYPKGTEIQVRNLFFNTPARLQNLKSENVELSYITDYVCKIALANPHIAFKLVNNETKIFQSFGNRNLLEVINNVYDSNVAKNMITVSGMNGIFKICGLTSNISVTRSSKNNITIIVNQRIVKNYNVYNAILDAYKTLLTVGRYPITVLEIMVDYSLVDVNVHPQKHEVRFSEEESLLELIRTTIAETLLRSNMIVNKDKIEKNESVKKEILSFEDVISNDSDEEYELNNENFENINDKDENIENKNESNESQNNSYEVFSDQTKTFIVKESIPIQETLDDLSDYESKDLSKYDEDLIDEDKNKKVVQTQIDFINETIDLNEENKSDNDFDKTNISKLYFIGQLFGTYILAQNDDGFYMIDQHAANERINYEKILKGMENEEVITYEIMFPLKLSFTPTEALLVKEKLPIISSLGIKLEDFGSGTFIVRVVPIWMAKNNISEYVEEIIFQIINNKKSKKIEFLDSIAKSLACKKSVKANEFLSQLQIEYLLEDLVKCRNPFTCPHGRPIIIKYSKYEIEKWFKRVQ